MHCSFHSAKLGPCTVHILASGKHGFSSPKLIRISSGSDDATITSAYRFLNRSISMHAHDELSNADLCRMAIAQFLRLNDEVHLPATLDLEFTATPYRGTLFSKNRGADRYPAGDAGAVPIAGTQVNTGLSCQGAAGEAL